MSKSQKPSTPSDTEVAKTLEGTLMFVGDSVSTATSRIHEFHRAISNMPFKAVDTATLSASKPIESIHNEITDAVYTAVRETGKGVFSGAAWVVRQANQSLASPQVMDRAMSGQLMRDVDDLPAPVQSGFSEKTGRRIAAISSAINGVFGDHLAVTRNPMEVNMGLYANGQWLDIEPAALKASIKNPQSHLVVFVHGLCCNEDRWRLYHREPDEATRPYGDKLEAEFPVNALYLRYNTGRSIEANARRFKRLLGKTMANWPVPVKGMTLVGHSMGGLVSRSLVEMLGEEDKAMKQAIADVVCLGSPHAGAPLARLAAAGEQLFSRFELSRPLGRVLGGRSRGIRDLDHGLGPLQTRDGQSVMFHLIGSTMGGINATWLNTNIGDGLVTTVSAHADSTGKAQKVTFIEKHHMNLLNDPDVFVEIRRVIGQHVKARRKPL